MIPQNRFIKIKKLYLAVPQHWDHQLKLKREISKESYRRSLEIGIVKVS